MMAFPSEPGLYDVMKASYKRGTSRKYRLVGTGTCATLSSATAMNRPTTTPTRRN